MSPSRHPLLKLQCLSCLFLCLKLVKCDNIQDDFYQSRNVNQVSGNRRNETNIRNDMDVSSTHAALSQDGGRNPNCLNTVQGRSLMTDDQGYVCPVKELESLSGCCPVTGESRYSCRQCNKTSQCCEVYEFCVSCCQDPLITPLEVAVNAPVSSQANTRLFSSVFEYCQSRCRHNSLSVVHENAYISDFHHCYKTMPTPSVEALDEDSSLENLTIVVASSGQSCDVACAATRTMSSGSKVCECGYYFSSDFQNKEQCDEKKLRILNACPMLQKYFSCSGTCVASTGSDQPAEVISSAPRHMHPGACLYNTDDRMFSCSGSHPHTRRLCPCALA